MSPPPQTSAAPTICGRYQLIIKPNGRLDVLGSGAYGIVCRAADLAQGSALVAIKLIFRKSGESLERQLGGELLLRALPPHDNVVRLLEFAASISSTEMPMEWIAQSLIPDMSFPRCFRRQGSRIAAPVDVLECAVLVFECVNGPELFDWLMDDENYNGAAQRPAEADAKTVMAGLVAAVAHLHAVGCVHLDIKLENAKIASEDSCVKLLDFGFAMGGEANISRVRGERGTAQYMAPEMHLQPEYDGRAADVFALGVCLYTLANGCTPWKHTELHGDKLAMDARGRPLALDDEGQSWGDHFKRYMRKGCTITRHMFGKPALSPALTDLLDRMLAPDPRMRLATAAHVAAHPWFTGVPAPAELPLPETLPAPQRASSDPVYRGGLWGDELFVDDSSTPVLRRLRALVRGVAWLAPHLADRVADAADEATEEDAAAPVLIPRRRAAIGGSVWDRPAAAGSSATPAPQRLTASAGTFVAEEDPQAAAVGVVAARRWRVLAAAALLVAVGTVVGRRPK